MLEMVEANAKGAGVPPGFLQLLQQLSSAHLQPLAYVRKRKKKLLRTGKVQYFTLLTR